MGGTGSESAPDRAAMEERMTQARSAMDGMRDNNTRAYNEAETVMTEAQKTQARALITQEREAMRQHGVAHYARQLAVSPGHLNVLSHRHLGRSAKAVITDRLSVQARRMLLYSTLSVAQVGYALGFRDPSYFTRFFRRENGRSPSAFRQMAGSDKGESG